jgi:hypothetical protein
MAEKKNPDPRVIAECVLELVKGLQRGGGAAWPEDMSLAETRASLEAELEGDASDQ